jgi:predicted  nucleic acid-binding Zn-ribbon protein
MVDWRLGDTDDLKKWIEKLAGASEERRTEIADLNEELRGIRQSVEAMQKQVDHIGQILSKVAE